jgi:membrane-anchored protein YejM (alkaline phosphatase superfamily)
MSVSHLDSANRGQLARWTGWFFLGNSLLLLLVGLRYLGTFNFPQQDYAVPFGILAYLGHFSFLGFLMSLAILPLVLVIPNKALVQTTAILLASLAMTILAIDTFIFDQYRFHLNGMVMNLLFGGAAMEIFSFSVFTWVLVLFGLTVILMVNYLLSQLVWKLVRATTGSRRYGLKLGLILFAIYLSQNFIYAWADATSYTAITKQNRLLPAYRPMTAKRFFISNGWAQPSQKIEQSGEVSELNYPLRTLDCGPPERVLNLVMVVIDSWRFDTHDAETTPNIFRFSRDSMRFENHFSPANSTRTGMFSLLYGIPGGYWHSMLAEQRGPVLVDQLQRNGYQMGIFASAKLYSPEFNRTLFASIKDLRLKSDGNTPSERDQDLTSDFMTFIQQRDPQRPFFSLLFYDAPHGYHFPPDYQPPFQPSWNSVNYLALNQNFDPTPFFNRYRNSVNFVDSLVGKVLSRLEQEQLLDNTVVVITGDHGQEFNDNGLNYWGHNSNFSRYQTQVPMIIAWPGKRAESFTHQTSHFDIAPSLMRGILGCRNNPDDYSQGKFLTEVQHTPYLILSNYSQLALMDDERILVFDEYNNLDTYSRDDYRIVADTDSQQSLILNAMKDMSRFYLK